MAKLAQKVEGFPHCKHKDGTVAGELCVYVGG